MKAYQVHETIGRLIQLQDLIEQSKRLAMNCLNVLDRGHWLTLEVDKINEHLDATPVCFDLVNRLVRELGAEIVRKEQDKSWNSFKWFAELIAVRVCEKPQNGAECGTCTSCTARAVRDGEETDLMAEVKRKA